MTGEDTGEREQGEDEARCEHAPVRVPVALRDRVDELFVDCRGYEPASFQESLSFVVDLAAGRAEGDGDDTAEVDATELQTATAGTDEPTPTATAADEPSGGTATASFDGTGDASTLSADPVDDVAAGEFDELSGAAVADDASETATADATDDEAALDAGSVPESLRADPESNCALCGDLHPVSVLETTIPDGVGSVALVCPECSE